MAEKPIIFSTPMIQAILEDRKTQTRRIVKPQPHDVPTGAYIDPYNKKYEYFTAWTEDNRMCLGYGGNIRGKAHWKPPYLPGDILWVRESHQYHEGANGHGYSYKVGGGVHNDIGKWRPSIHMPRAAARIFLKVTDVRMERVQEINEEDAKAEGIRSYWLTKEAGKNADDWHESSSPPFVGVAKEIGLDLCSTRCEAYNQLWDSLNAKRGYSWDTNPWVWAYTFERVTVE